MAVRLVQLRVAQKALQHVYTQTGELQQGWTCPGSSDCCRLAQAKQEPYAWPLEWDRVVAALARRGRALPLPPRPDGACPLLNEQGRCSEYADRPLGCRTYFCHRGTGPTALPRASVTALMVKVQGLSNDLDPDVGAPLPLRALLLGQVAFEGRGGPEGDDVDSEA